MWSINLEFYHKSSKVTTPDKDFVGQIIITDILVFHFRRYFELIKDVYELIRKNHLIMLSKKMAIKQRENKSRYFKITR